MVSNSLVKNFVIFCTMFFQCCLLSNRCNSHSSSLFAVISVQLNQYLTFLMFFGNSLGHFLLDLLFLFPFFFQVVFRLFNFFFPSQLFSWHAKRIFPFSCDFGFLCCCCCYIISQRSSSSGFWKSPFKQCLSDFQVLNPGPYQPKPPQNLPLYIKIIIIILSSLVVIIETGN